MTTIIQENAEVLANAPLTPGYYTMTLGCSKALAASRPGQFVMLSVAPGPPPLLRRPFSIHRLEADAAGRVELQILYKVVGQGTTLLARTPTGATLSLLGPLGRGFVLREDYRCIYLAAGGIGAAPMVFLLERLHQAGRTCEVFLGGRSREDLLCREIFQDLAREVVTITPDATIGEAARVMAQRSVKRLPVVTDDGALVGFVDRLRLQHFLQLHPPDDAPPHTA